MDLGKAPSFEHLVDYLYNDWMPEVGSRMQRLVFLNSAHGDGWRKSFGEQRHDLAIIQIASP